jgi:hypothetical protein
MMFPTEIDALAEARRETFEREMRLAHQLAELPQPPARWRQWTGNGLMWAGARLVNWGEGLAIQSHAHGVDVTG